MKSRILVALALAAALWPTCSGLAAPPPAGGPCLSLTASSAQQAMGASSADFSATRIVNIDLNVLFGSIQAGTMTTPRVVTVKVFSPRGNLYQTFSFPVQTSPVTRGQEQRVDGYPEPVAVQALTAQTYNGARVYGAKATLPVAGTPIISNSLYGTWSAEASLDSQQAACTAKMRFSIRQ
jgi:hypothetical protein